MKIRRMYAYIEYIVLKGKKKGKTLFKKSFILYMHN